MQTPACLCNILSKLILFLPSVSVCHRINYTCLLTRTFSDPSTSTQIGPLTNGQYLIIHGSLVLCVIVFSFMRLGAYVATIMRAAANIHDIMFQNLIRATMRFFDTQPSGETCFLFILVLFYYFILFSLV